MFLPIVPFGNFAHTENDQTIVLDMGSGVHFFNEADEFRDANTFVNNNTWVGQLRAEWYLFDNISIGYRALNIFGTRTHFELRKEYAIRNIVFTVNFVPFGGTRYARVILVYGMGTGKNSARES